MGEIEKIDEEIRKLVKAKRQLEESHFREKTLPKMRALIGSVFKYRNCYSCPQTDEDYWWMYTRITEASEEGLVGVQIQRDRDGKISVQTAGFMLPMLDGYVEISKAEFDAAVGPLVLAIRHALER